MLKTWASRLAPVYPGEGRVVVLCMAINLLVVAGIMFGRNARDSLFLNSYGVQFLPYMYFANAIVLVVCSLFYTSLVDRIDRGRFLGSVSLIFVGLLVGSRALLAGEPRWFYPVLYILAQAIWNFSLLQFWTFLGDLFDTRQAKRLFPLIAVGSLLGMIGVGLTSRPAVKALGTENILLIWAGLIGSALVLGTIVYKKYRPPKPPPAADKASAAPPRRPSEWEKFKEGASRLKNEPLLRNMAFITFLLWTIFTVVDFNFSSVMKQTYPDKNVLTGFFGAFRGIAGFLCLIIQLFLTAAVISRLGVGTTITFHPTFLMLSTLWMTLSFGYTSVYAAKMGDHVLLYTFQDSSFQLLYSAVMVEQRARIRGFIDGYIKPLSMAAAGVLLLLGTRYLSLRQIAMIGFVLSIGWVAVSLTTKKGYIGALLRNLEADNPAVRQAAAAALTKMRDPATVAAFAEKLGSTPADRLVPALQLLETLDVGQAQGKLADLLSHPDARVRATAVGMLGRHGIAGHEAALVRLLADPDPRVRANAVDALEPCKDPLLAAKLRPLLKDPSTRTRINAVVTLASLEGSDAVNESLPLLEELSRGDSVARSAATYALGRLPVEQSMIILSGLLKDPELHIRCEAAQALGRVGGPRVIPHLVEALAGAPELRHHARRSLAHLVTKCGTVCIDELMGIAISSAQPEIRSELADVLGRIKDPRVLEPLLGLLKDPEWRVRWKVLKSFERLARDGPLPENAREALFEYAHAELAAFRYSLDCTRALLPSPASEAELLLARALEEDRANIQERVFRMLGVLCGRETMKEIAHELRSKDLRQRADALEVLDTLAPKAIGRELLALLEPAPTVASAAQPAGPVLWSLTSHPKPWVRACTGYYLGVHDHPGRESMLKSMLANPAPLVRDTALAAGWKAFREAWRPQIETACASTDTPTRLTAQTILARGDNGLGKVPTSSRKGEIMLLSIEKAIFLKSAPLFSALEGEELAALGEIAIENAYAPGEVIFEENQEPHHLYIVVQGKVEVFRRVQGHDRALAHLGEKECFGEMAILDDLPRSASVRAEEPTTALKIDRDSFHELIMERPQMAFAIFKILSGRLRQQNLEADHIPTVFSGGEYA